MFASATQPTREPREPARDPAREPEQGCQARVHSKLPKFGCPSLDFDRKTLGGFWFSTAFDLGGARSQVAMSQLTDLAIGVPVGCRRLRFCMAELGAAE